METKRPGLLARIWAKAKEGIGFCWRVVKEAAPWFVFGFGVAVLVSEGIGVLGLLVMGSLAEATWNGVVVGSICLVLGGGWLKYRGVSWRMVRWGGLIGLSGALLFQVWVYGILGLLLLGFGLVGQGLGFLGITLLCGAGSWLANTLADEIYEETWKEAWERIKARIRSKVVDVEVKSQDAVPLEVLQLV